MKLTDFDAATQQRILTDLQSVPPNGHYHISDAPNAFIVRAASATARSAGALAHSNVYVVATLDDILLETFDPVEAINAALDA